MPLANLREGHILLGIKDERRWIRGFIASVPLQAVGVDKPQERFSRRAIS